MQRTRFDQMTCPIARALDRVGEWWSMLVMRDVLRGTTRFDALVRDLGIAPNMLARRLSALVEAGLLERRPYAERPPRFEYVPTACGRELEPVLLALFAWGNRHFAADGRPVRLVDALTGDEADPVLVDRATGRPIASPAFAARRVRPLPAPPTAPEDDATGDAAADATRTPTARAAAPAARPRRRRA